MLGLSGWLGGFFGARGNELVRESSDGIREALGTGQFSEDRDSQIEQLRDVLAVGVAFIRAYGEKLLLNSNPATAVDTLDAWEDTLAVPRYGRYLYGYAGTGSIQERQALLKQLCRRSRSANVNAIYEVLWYMSSGRLNSITLAAAYEYEFHFNPTVSLDPPAIWSIMRYLRWVMPAHVTWSLAYP